MSQRTLKIFGKGLINKFYILNWINNFKMVRKIDGFTRAGIHLREKFSVVMMIKMAIVFVLSLILYYASNNEVISAFFGLIMILSGSLILLFILIYLIFFFVERIDGGKNAPVVKKKTVRKKAVVKKKIVKKKAVRKKAKK